MADILLSTGGTMGNRTDVVCPHGAYSPTGEGRPKYQVNKHNWLLNEWGCVNREGWART